MAVDLRRGGPRPTRRGPRIAARAPARRWRRRARLRGHLPPHLGGGRSLRRVRPRRPGCAAGGHRLPDAAGDPVRGQLREHRARGVVRVRPRSRRARVGVVDRDRPGRRRGGVRLRPPAAPRPGPGSPAELGRHGPPAHCRPAPAAAGRVDARRLHRRDGDRRPGRRAHPRGPPDRGEPVLPARLGPRLPGDPGADARRRRARPGHDSRRRGPVDTDRPSVRVRRRRARGTGRCRGPAAPPHLHQRWRRGQPGDGGPVVAGGHARPRGDRVRLRRRAHRRRRLPLPRPRRPRLPGRDHAGRARRARPRPRHRRHLGRTHAVDDPAGDRQPPAGDPPPGSISFLQLDRP